MLFSFYKTRFHKRIVFSCDNNHYNTCTYYLAHQIPCHTIYILCSFLIPRFTATIRIIGTMPSIISFRFFNFIDLFVVLVLFSSPLLVFRTQGMASCISFRTIGFTRIRFHRPVLPKPPVPLSVASSSSTTSSSGVIIGSNTSCIIFSPAFIKTISSPRL